MNDKTYKLVCSICGGTNIETKAWVDPNSDNVLDSCSDEEWEDNWCNDCDSHCGFDIVYSVEND